MVRVEIAVDHLAAGEAEDALHYRGIVLDRQMAARECQVVRHRQPTIADHVASRGPDDGTAEWIGDSAQRVDHG